MFSSASVMFSLYSSLSRASFISNCPTFVVLVIICWFSIHSSSFNSRFNTVRTSFFFVNSSISVSHSTLLCSECLAVSSVSLFVSSWLEGAQLLSSEFLVPSLSVSVRFKPSISRLFTPTLLDIGNCSWW